MKLNKVLVSVLSSYLLIGATTVSCSGGANNNSQVAQQRPQGPVSYMQIDDMFSSSNAQSLQSKQLNAAGGCGSIMSDASTGLIIASGFVSFIPVIGPALAAISSTAGTITGFAGAGSASNCVSQTLANQQYQLASQELQISQLNNQMTSSNNIIWAAIANNSQVALNNANTAYSDDTQHIISANGFASTFLQRSGFWEEGSDYQPVPSYNIESLLTNTNNYTNTLNYLNSINLVAQSVTGATGSNISMASQTESALTNYNVTQSNSSSLMRYYSAIYNYITDEITQNIETGNTTNMIESINQYNNYIINVYQNSIVTLNAAYQTAYMVNMINYQNHISGAQQQYLLPVFTLTGTYYDPTQHSSESQATVYNNIQHSLTNLVAGMANQLYNNTISYIITDPMTKAQILNATGNLQYISTVNGKVVQAESVNYTQLGQNVESATALIVQAIGNGLTLNNNNYESSFQNSFYNIGNNNGSLFGAESILFYQFAGVGNIVNINRSLVQYNESYGTSGNLSDFLTSYMPSESVNTPYPAMPAVSNTSNIFVESAIATATTIQPYYINQSGYPQLFGSVTNNLSACNGTGSTIAGGLSPYNFYVYTPNGVNPSLGQQGVPYFMCGNWSTLGIQTQITNTNTTDVATYYSGLSPNFYKYTNGTLIIYSNSVSNDPAYGLTGEDLSACLSGAAGAGNQNEPCGNFPTTGNAITMMNFESQNWGNGSDRTNNSVQHGSSFSSIFTGWMANNYPSGLSNGDAVTNLAAIQITLPDGFIAPLVVANTNINGWQGTYIGMGYNPNVASVTIDGQPLLDGSNALYGNTNTWGIVASNTQASYNGDNSHFFPIPAITVNGNTIMMNSNTWAPEEGTYENWAAQAYITLNPINCPAWTGPYSTQSRLLPQEGSGATGMTDYQIFNFVCTLPTYNGFFGG